MTEEEKKRDRRLKADVTERLFALRPKLTTRYRYALDDTDKRIRAYVEEVIDHPDGHNLYEQLGVERFFCMLEKYGWRPKRVRRFIKFYQALRFSDAEGRRRHRMTPVQVFQFANIFGFVNEKGRRLIRTVYFFIPRKFGKTTSVASLAVYDMLFGDNNAQAYVGANSYDQAKICFDEIRAIMIDIDPSERHFTVNREQIFFKDRDRDSFIRCLTANAKTKDGMNASLAIMDEYAQARNTAGKNGADLKNVITSSMGVRREPLTVVITTASDVLDGPFVHELDGVKKVLRGEMEVDTMFASLFMLDVDDSDDDPKSWAKVQPHLGITVQEDYYKLEWETAQLSGEKMKDFQTKYLNRFVQNEEKRWMTRKQAESLMAPPGRHITDVKGLGAVMGAFDLSVRDDMSAVGYVGYSELDRCFHAHIDYYLPRDAAARHTNHASYELWHEQGYLKYCDGDVMDDLMVLDDIVSMGSRIKITRMGYDKYKALDLVNLLSLRSGKGTIVPYSQTIGSFNLPVEMFEKLAFARPPRIIFDYNPITVWQLTNCVMVEDNLENRKPFKAAPDKKIDGIICMLMCLGLAGQ